MAVKRGVICNKGPRLELNLTHWSRNVALVHWHLLYQVQGTLLHVFLNVSGFPTAHGPAWRSGPLRVGVSLPLGPIHNGPSKDAFQLFGVWWGDGVAADRQLHQRQTHAPHVRLYRVVSALQSLRLLRNTQSTSVGAGRAKTPGRREGWAEGWVRKAQEVEGRIMAGKEVVGGVMARS